MESWHLIGYLAAFLERRGGSSDPSWVRIQGGGLAGSSTAMICCTKERGSPPTAPGSMDPMTKTDLAQYVDQIAADFGLGSPPGVSRGCCGVSTPLAGSMRSRELNCVTTRHVRGRRQARAGMTCLSDHLRRDGSPVDVLGLRFQSPL